MIELTEIQSNIYGQFLDALAKDNVVMLNVLMRFGKTPLIMKYLLENDYQRIVIITDEEYSGYLRLMEKTRLIENQNIFFMTEEEIPEIIDPDIIVIDDLQDYVELNYKCKKIYMCGVLNESFTKNIKTILKYTYNDYIKDNETPLLKILKPGKNVADTINKTKKLPLIDKHIILVIGDKTKTYDLLEDFRQNYLVLWSETYNDVKQLIKKKNMNTIICSSKLTKNISIPLCEVVIIQETEEVIEAAFRPMLEVEIGQQKQFSFVYFMNKKYEEEFREYFNDVDPSTFDFV